MLFIAVSYRRCGRNLWAKLDTVINSLSANHTHTWKRSILMLLKFFDHDNYVILRYHETGGDARNVKNTIPVSEFAVCRISTDVNRTDCRENSAYKKLHLRAIWKLRSHNQNAFCCTVGAVMDNFSRNICYIRKLRLYMQTKIAKI